MVYFTSFFIYHYMNGILQFFPSHHPLRVQVKTTTGNDRGVWIRDCESWELGKTISDRNRKGK